MPRSIGGAGLLDHLIDRCLIRIPFVTVTPVLVCDFPLFFRCILSLIKTLKLRIFVDLHPEFNDHSTPVVKFFFKFVDLIVSTHPVIFTAKSLQTLHHHSSVPCAVKNSDMSCFRQSRPETPQVMSCFLMRFRACDRMNFVTARIKCSCNPLDVAAFSCCIPALISDDDRYFFPVKTVVQFSKPILQFFQFFAVLIRLNLFVQRHFCQKRHPH